MHPVGYVAPLHERPLNMADAAEHHAHPYKPETLRDFITHYCLLAAGVGGVGYGVYGVNLLSNNPEIWMEPGLRLMEWEITHAPAHLVPLSILAITAAKIGTDFLLLWRGNVLVSKAEVPRWRVELYRWMTHGVRLLGRAYNSLMTAAALTGAGYYLLKEYGLGQPSNASLTFTSLLVGCALPFSLLRTNLLCKLLPAQTRAMLKNRSTGELASFDTAVPRLHAALSRRLTLH